MTALPRVRQVNSWATRPTLLFAARVDHQLKRQRSDTFNYLGDAAILCFPSLSIVASPASGVGICSSIWDWELRYVARRHALAQGMLERSGAVDCMLSSACHLGFTWI